MYVSAIVLAGGLGLRFKSKVPKPLLKINSQPVIIHCLETFSRHSLIKDIILVVNPFNKKGIISSVNEHRIKKIRDIVLGGKERRDSVRNALGALSRRTDLVLIHDGVRPFIDKELVSLVIKEAGKCGAAIVGVPVKATIKSIKVSKYQSIKDKFIVGNTLDRDNLWEIQTPQVFKKELILEAYKKFGNTEVSDDAMLVEKLGVEVRVVRGSYNNIKITTREDLVIAEAIAKEYKKG